MDRDFQSQLCFVLDVKDGREGGDKDLVDADNRLARGSIFWYFYIFLIKGAQTRSFNKCKILKTPESFNKSVGDWIFVSERLIFLTNRNPCVIF